MFKAWQVDMIYTPEFINKMLNVPWHNTKFILCVYPMYPTYFIHHPSLPLSNIPSLFNASNLPNKIPLSYYLQKMGRQIICHRSPILQYYVIPEYLQNITPKYFHDVGITKTKQSVSLSYYISGVLFKAYIFYKMLQK